MSQYHTLAVAVVLVLLIVFFTIENSSAFFTISNFRNVSLDASATMLLAVGLTFLMISGGIDLSVGSVVVFASVVSAKAMEGLPDTLGTALLGLLVALAGGFAWGLVNGVLIAKGRLSPLIVTLGTLGAAEGLGNIISGGADLRTIPPSLTTGLGIGRFLGVPYLLYITFGLTLIAGIVLAKTRFGAHTYAIGANEEAARRAGIRVDLHRISLYTMTGLLAGLTAYLLNAYFGTTTITGHSTDNLEAITAVLLGGVSLYGGTGNMIGSVIGVFIPAVLLNGFTIINVSSFWQEVAVGFVLIGAVGLDRIRRRHLESP